MDYHAYNQELLRQALQDEYDDFAHYLEVFDGDVRLAIHYFNEDRRRNDLPLITAAEADEYLVRWRAF